MTTSSAQQAALRILLEDVEPMLRQAEAFTTTLAQVRMELDADLRRLSDLVQRTTDAQSSLHDATRKVAGSATRIEDLLRAGPPFLGASNAAVQRRHGVPWAVCAAIALVSAGVVAGASWVHSRELVEQARIGQALQRAWPSLDSALRAKVQDALDGS